MEEEFCYRLRRERQRLGLSQKEFAERAGISRVTQGNYESGKRFPGEGYFSSIKKLGVDDYYLISGLRLNQFSNEAFAREMVLFEVADRLGLDRGAFRNAVEEIAHISPSALESDNSEVIDNHCAGLVWVELSQSPVLLDADALAKVLSCLRDEMARQGVTMPAEKEAKAIVMLYKAFRVAGNVDREMVATTVSLSAG